MDARIIIGEFSYIGARKVFCEVSGIRISAITDQLVV